MQPEGPVIPGFSGGEVVYGAGQSEYRPLPAVKTQDGHVMSRWTFTEEERAAVAMGADVHVEMLTFNGALQPVRLTVLECPRDIENKATEYQLTRQQAQ